MSNERMTWLYRLTGIVDNLEDYIDKITKRNIEDVDITWHVLERAGNMVGISRGGARPLGFRCDILHSFELVGRTEKGKEIRYHMSGPSEISGVVPVGVGMRVGLERVASRRLDNVLKRLVDAGIRPDSHREVHFNYPEWVDTEPISQFYS